MLPRMVTKGGSRLDSTLFFILVDNTIIDTICYHDRVAGFGVPMAKCNVEFLHCNIVRYCLGQEHVASSLKELEAKNDVHVREQTMA